jgi:hypothetical protein
MFLIPFVLSSLLFSSKTRCVPNRPRSASLWGSYKDSLIEDTTYDKIQRAGVATTFDYVIVGGGTAGLTLAARLTEDSRIRVAVIEYGGLSKMYYTYQPGQLATSCFVDPANPAIDSTIDWVDISVPLKVNGYRQHYPQGKMLGGTSARGFSV